MRQTLPGRRLRKTPVRRVAIPVTEVGDLLGKRHKRAARVSRQLTPLVISRNASDPFIGFRRNIPLAPFCGVNSGSPNDPFRTSIAPPDGGDSPAGHRNGLLLRLIVCEGRGQIAVCFGLLLKR